MENLQVLRTLLERLPARLKAFPSDQLSHKSRPDTWSPKEEFGHLLDSAANNYQRIVRAQLEDNPAMPNYDGERWVALQQYQERNWSELMASWVALNRQLLSASEAASGSKNTRTCTIGNSAPLTLQFVFDDYIDHMLHHLRHMGMDVANFALTKATGQ